MVSLWIIWQIRPGFLFGAFLTFNKFVMRKDKKQIALEHLIDEMFKIAGYKLTYNDIKDRQDNWYQQYTMTEDQNKQWRDYGVAYIIKKHRVNKKSAELSIAMLDLHCGLKIKNYEN